MVTRKAMPPTSKFSVSSDKSILPYPAIPSSEDAPSAFSERDTQRIHPFTVETEPDAQNTWRSDDFGEEYLPTPLRPEDGKQGIEASDNGVEDIPEPLRAGHPGYSSRSSGEMQRPTAKSTNSYIRRQQTGHSVSSEGRESRAAAWGRFADRPQSPPPPPPVPKDTPPKKKFEKLSIAEQNTNLWQPSIDIKPLPQQPQVPSLQLQDSRNEGWSSTPAPSWQAPVIPQPPVLITLPSEESPAWEEDDPPSQVQLTPTPSSDLDAAQSDHEEESAWEENGRERQREQFTIASQRKTQAEYLQTEGGWESEIQPQEYGVIGGESIAPEEPLVLPARPSTEGEAPPLPLRRSHEDSPTRLPRSMTGDSTSSLPASGTSTTIARRQKKETYDIKKVAWYDATASSNPRVSPILVQNANGPCPLLALVNALTLSTPADLNTALVETLRSREQVSLGLLLDAVFDELMSGRRGDAAQELPDVGDLYAFLVTLHTGMNVNPRFFPPAPTNLMEDPRRSMSHVHPTEREESIPGTFEETREMKLYSTFSIPLIHGWLPLKDSPAYTALARCAKTYEDAQNLMFREEDLEEKLQKEGLSFEEQATLEDIATIKAFFNESATQLTSYGLETITNSIAPGSVAILFRNDHFSTLYRHPESHQLLHLVTDMGYAGHEEVVWESLADVNGENCEFFSGDFRIVGDAPSNSIQSVVDGSEWTAVSQRDNQSQNNLQNRQSLTAHGSEAVGATPMSPNTEQEDHDLALALQLQEEEEQRHQAEVARRRREAELSQQYIEQQGSQQAGSGNIAPVSVRGGRGSGHNQGRGRGQSGGASELRPPIPPRRSNTNPPVPIVDPEVGVDIPPPSYEQAATQPSYIPPVDHPAHPSASARGSGVPLTRRMSAYSASAAAYNSSQARSSRPAVIGRVNTTGSRAGARINETQSARRQQGLTQQQQQERERDCIVM